MTRLVSEFEWRASARYAFYPFADRPEAAGEDLSGLFADACVSGPSARIALTRLLQIDATTWEIKLNGEEPEWEATTVAYGRPYAPWVILLGDGVRLLCLAERLASLPVVENAWFVPHVLQVEPLRLTGIRVGGERLAGRVALVPGYNLDVRTAAGSGAVRTGARVSLGVEPGAGAGLEPCPPGDCRAPVRRLNGVSPNANGNLALEGADCYNATPVLGRTGDGAAAYLAGNALRLTNSCSPCCDCSDYGYLYGEVLGSLLDRARGLAVRHAELRERYARMLEEHERIAACRAVPSVELKVTGMYNRTAAVALGFHNNSAAPWPAAPAQLAATVDPAAGCRLVAGSAVRHDGSDSRLVAHSFADGVFSFTLPPIPCCSTHWIAFHVTWDGTGGFVAFAVASSGTVDGVAYAAAASGSTRPPANRRRS
jgi:hypothetical protein